MSATAHLVTFLVFWLVLTVFIVLNVERMVSALNSVNHNATILLLFFLGVTSAFIGVLLLAYFPQVDGDVGKGAAGLGAMIISAAGMGFRSANDPPQPPPPPTPPLPPLPPLPAETAGPK